MSNMIQFWVNVNQIWPAFSVLFVVGLKAVHISYQYGDSV